MRLASVSKDADCTNDIIGLNRTHFIMRRHLFLLGNAQINQFTTLD